MIRLFILFLLTLPLSKSNAADGQVVTGITFAASPGKTYLPLAEAAELLDWPLQVDNKARTVALNDKKLNYWSLRRYTTGELLVELSDLAAAGATLTRVGDGTPDLVSVDTRSFSVELGKKRVFVDLQTHRLKAWQGQRLVLDCHISAGRSRRTPTGDFTAGPYKARWHRSSRYNNAPMPYSVQITGHIFVHGFTSVPSYHASRGCVRMHLDQGNPARYFYEWVDRGVPVRISRTSPPPEKPIPFDTETPQSVLMTSSEPQAPQTEPSSTEATAPTSTEESATANP